MIIEYSVWWSQPAVDEDLPKQIESNVLVSTQQLAFLQTILELLAKCFRCRISELEHF